MCTLLISKSDFRAQIRLFEPPRAYLSGVKSGIFKRSLESWGTTRSAVSTTVLANYVVLYVQVTLSKTSFLCRALGS